GIPMRKEPLPLAVSAEAYPADPDFPQLKIATDPALMLGIFREHLKPVAGKSYHLEECIPCRFRCRQSGSRCVLQYILRFVETGIGCPIQQWVTGVLYEQNGQAEWLYREMRASDPHPEIPEPWLTFEPLSFIPELQMLVEVFPYDHKLPNLAKVLGRGLRALERQFLARFGPGQWLVEQRHLEPTRYRTELGAALKYTLQARDAVTGKSQTRRCYCKVYRNEHGAGTFQLLRSLSDQSDRSDGLRG